MPLASEHMPLLERLRKGDYAGLDYIAELWLSRIRQAGALFYLVLAIFGWCSVHDRVRGDVPQAEDSFVVSPSSVRVVKHAADADSFVNFYQSIKVDATDNNVGWRRDEIAGLVWRDWLRQTPFFYGFKAWQSGIIKAHFSIDSDMVRGRLSVICIMPTPCDPSTSDRSPCRISHISKPNDGSLVGSKIFDCDSDGFARLLSRIDAGGNYEDGQQRINTDASASDSRPEKGLLIVFSALFFSALVCSLKGIYRESCLMLFGGWCVAAIASVILALWVIIGHNPLRFSENVSAAPGIDASAPRYGTSENVRVIPIVVTELKLRDVQRQIFAADFVEAAHDAGFEQRPEAIDCLSVHHAIDIASTRMPNKLVREVGLEFPITGMLVSREQADFGGNSGAHSLPHIVKIARGFGLKR